MASIEAAEFFAPEALQDPYPLYARLRALGPVCELRGTRAFFVGHHQAVGEAVLRHQEFSANLTGVLVRGDDGVPRVFDFGGSGTANEVIATADEPAHAPQRRLLMPPLKASRIATMEPAIRAFAEERIDAFVSAGGGDWCDALAEPLPAFVVTRLLGLGPGHLGTVRRWAMMGGDLLGGCSDFARMSELLRETSAMTTFLAAQLDSVAARAEGEAEVSLTTALVAGVADGVISREQAIGILVILFGAAGESTAALTGTALELMLRTPGLQEELRAYPERIGNFVEEAVRLESPFKFHYRVVRRDTSLRGTALRAGDRLLLGWASANRDGAAIEQADTVRLDRARPQDHLGFGHGIHFCIGAPLARLEVRVAIEALLAQSARIEPDTSRNLAYVPSIFVRRLHQLQVRVEPLRRTHGKTELLDAAAIRGDLPLEVEVKDTIPSTNAELLERVRAGLPVHGFALLAEQQTQGRGRRGRAWVSPRAANLYVSLGWRMESGAPEGFSLAIGIAVARAVHRCLGARVQLKWPNDIVVDGRKLGGILVEMHFEPGGAATAVIGIGLNVAMSDEVAAVDIDQPWTDLRTVCGRPVCRNALAAALLAELLVAIDACTKVGFAALRAEWSAHDVLRGREVTVSGAGADLQGKAAGVDERGALLLVAEGILHTVVAGEVSVRTCA